MTHQYDNPYAAPPNPPDKDGAEWGPSPPHVYRCRKSVRWAAYGFLMLGAAVVLYLGASLAVSQYRAGLSITPASAVAWGFWAIMLLAVLVGWWALDRVASVSVVLEDGTLVYRHRGGDKRLRIDEITSVELVQVLVPSLRLRSAGDTVALTVRLERISRLVLSLKAALDARGSSQSYDHDQLFRFFRFAAYQDESRQLVEANILKLLFLIALSGLVGRLLALVQDGSEHAAIWVIVSTHWPVVVYAVTDHIIFLRFKRRADKNTFSCPPSDPLWVRRIYLTALCVGAVLYAAAAIVAFLI
jgi:hypothetical protein